jgi:hypothetical protein
VTVADRTKFLQLARDRFKQAQTAEKDQRARELEDLKFYAGDQWPEDVKTIRAGQVAQNGLPPVPARPCLTINKTREPVRQVLNQERQSDMGIEIVPADDFGELTGPIDDTEIQLREGLVRRIQRDSQAQDARTWAFARACIAGRGYYGVMTRYAKGKTQDQEVYIHRFYNQSCVTIDPAHEQPDGSDAEWAFVGTDMSEDEYKAQFGKRNRKKNVVCDWTSSDWSAVGDETKDWFQTSEKGTRIYRVVDYWYTVRTNRELVTLEDATGQQRVEWTDEIEGKNANPELVAQLNGWMEVQDSRRDVVQKSIKFAKIDGCDDDVLEETDWPGPDIPIIKVLGEELQPYDKERRIEGMVRPMREPGQGFNYMVSRWVEVIGLSPLPPIMMAEGQDEGYEAEWDAINTRTLGRVHYRQVDIEGRQAPAPSVPPDRNPPIAAIAGSVQMFDEAIQSTSGHPAPSLGQVDPSVKSGRAIKALQEQAAKGSNHYLDNSQRSTRYEGQVVNNLLYPIYGRPGRIARIVNGENEPETILLHQPMIVQDGRPALANEGNPNAKKYTLTKDAQFNVMVKVSKNFDSRREQEVSIIGDLLSAEPSLMTWFGDLFFANQDGPGHQQMADRAKVMLAPPIQQMLQQKQQGTNIPPQVQAQLAQSQQQIEQLQAELQKAQKPTAVEEIRQQGDTARKAADLDFQREKLATESETKLAVAELGAKVDRLTLFLEERARLGVQDHEVGMTAMAQAHAADQAAAGRSADTEAAEAARAHEAEMAERAAAAAQTEAV